MTEHERCLQAEQEHQNRETERRLECASILMEINDELRREFTKVQAHTYQLIAEWLQTWLRRRFPDANPKWLSVVRNGDDVECLQLPGEVLRLLRERDGEFILWTEQERRA